MWLTIGTGMLILLIAAMGKQKRDTCKDFVISIKSKNPGEVFLDRTQVLQLLKAATNGNIKGQSKSAIDLQRMEKLLEDNQWVKEAQLYFDNKDVLHVTVNEREPLVRIFTDAGRSFYMDEDGEIMNLSDKQIVRLPVFTGFPGKKMQASKDSALRKDIITTANYISENSFWNSQVAQVQIAESGNADFTIVPVVGNHTIQIGDANDIPGKFDRALMFYKQVLARSGLDKYKSIDVRFAGQVVGRKSDNPKVDSVQLRKNVQKLLDQIKEMEKLNDADAKMPTATPVRPLVSPGDTLPHPGEMDAANSPAAESPVMNPKPIDSKPVERTQAQTRTENRNPKPAGSRTPKAVMPKRGN